MSFYAMAIRGITPFGSLSAGFMASKVGTPNTLIIGGASCILGPFLFTKKLPLLREMVRPICVKKGILLEEPREVWPPDIHIDGAW
jgi:hypothetical protein